MNETQDEKLMMEAYDVIVKEHHNNPAMTSWLKGKTASELLDFIETSRIEGLYEAVEKVISGLMIGPTTYEDIAGV